MLHGRKSEEPRDGLQDRTEKAMFEQILEGDEGVGQAKLREEHSRKGSNQHKGPEADVCLAYVEWQGGQYGWVRLTKGESGRKWGQGNSKKQGLLRWMGIRFFTKTKEKPQVHCCSWNTTSETDDVLYGD